MKRPLVSIITASHKRPDFLRRCIMAIQKQNFVDYEHIIVADHCPYSENVYNEFKDDPRLVFSTTDGPHVFNRGGMSKNKGIAIARGDYICYCDDDNVLLPNHVQVLFDEITKTEADVCYSKMYHVRHFTPRDKAMGIKNYKKILERNIFDYSGYDNDGIRDMLTCIHKKNLANDLHVWPLRRDLGTEPEDDHMMDRFQNTKDISVVYVDEYTCIYNAHKGMGTVDKEWDEKISNMKENQVYVYEDIIPKH